MVPVEALRAAGAASAPALQAASSGGPTFVDVMARALDQVDQAQRRADGAAGALAAGRTQDVHGVVLAVTEAELSFRLALEVRNKVVEAWQEVSRMQA